MARLPAIGASVAAALAAVVLIHAGAVAEGPAWAPGLDALVKSYPDFLERVEGNELVWKDGERMVIDDGKGEKDFETRLDSADIKDQFHWPYPLGRAGTPPGMNSDPGRVRYAPLFDKMYGKCTQSGGESGRFIEIAWPPGRGGQKLKVSVVNGVAAQLSKVSEELDKLPPQFLKFLAPSAGTLNCRVIAGTDRVSTHGYGIAIDINAEHSDYWRWSKAGAGDARSYNNRIPWEIVEIFEKHGFIWGGKWYHYDTMHFEYRPELIAAAKVRE